MDKPTARRGDFRAVVLSNRQINPGIFLLSLEFGKEAATSYAKYQPGQFVELDLSQTALPPQDTIPADLRDKACRHVLLRRPFSLSNLLASQDGFQAELIYCVVGPASLRMTSLRRGDNLWALGPLGHGFDVMQYKTHALLVLGGMGAGPILHLARDLAAHHLGLGKTAFAGARTRDAMPLDVQGDKSPQITEFADLGIEHHIATDDGSMGHRGFITDCLSRWLDEHKDLSSRDLCIYACGPEPMLAAVARIASKAGIDCQVSMERRMACGFGACQGCAVECRSGEGQDTVYRLCCQDGPVFDARLVAF